MQRPHEGLGGLEDHAVVADVGDRAARGDGRQAGATPAAQPPVHAVVVDVGAAPAPLRGESLGQHLDDVVELWACEVAVGPSRTRQVEQPVLFPLLASRGRHDLLRQDVEWLLGYDQPVQPAGPHRAQQRRALDQVIP